MLCFAGVTTQCATAALCDAHYSRVMGFTTSIQQIYILHRRCCSDWKTPYSLLHKYQQEFLRKNMY